MKIGTIAFIKGTSWVSRIVRWVDKGEFTHVAIAVSDTELIEAQRFQLVRSVPISDAIIEFIDLKLTKEEEEALIREANQLLGKQYDYAQLLWHTLKIISGGRFKRINNPSRLICSELVSRSLCAAGIVEEEDTLFDLTPNELFDYLQYIMHSRRPV